MVCRGVNGKSQIKINDKMLGAKNYRFDLLEGKDLLIWINTRTKDAAVGFVRGVMNDSGGYKW